MKEEEEREMETKMLRKELKKWPINILEKNTEQNIQKFIEKFCGEKSLESY